MKNLIASLRNKLYYGFRSPYGTHSPFLESALQYLLEGEARASGVLFEIGTGGRSSEVLQHFLASHPRFSLIAFEHDPRWSRRYRKAYPEHDNFRIVDIKSEEEWEKAINLEVSRLDKDSLSLAFIDSSPWQSRSSSVKILKNLAEIVLVHDVDYFPRNNYFGTEESPILHRPKSWFMYGNLQEENLGGRNYSDVFKYWVEGFPLRPGYFTGPPTLIGSNLIDVKQIPFPKESIILS